MLLHVCLNRSADALVNILSKLYRYVDHANGKIRKNTIVRDHR